MLERLRSAESTVRDSRDGGFVIHFTIIICVLCKNNNNNYKLTNHSLFPSEPPSLFLSLKKKKKNKSKALVPKLQIVYPLGDDALLLQL